MRLQIGDDAPILDISTWKLELIKSPQQYGGNIKSSNIITTDFPEEDGVEVYIPATPKIEAVDYTVTLAFYSETKNQASLFIREFVNSLMGKKIVIYNDYKKVKLEGYFKDYKDGEFYGDTKVVLFDITFLIPKPNLIETL